MSTSDINSLYQQLCELSIGEPAEIGEFHLKGKYSEMIGELDFFPRSRTQYSLESTIDDLYPDLLTTEIKEKHLNVCIETLNERGYWIEARDAISFRLHSNEGAYEFVDETFMPSETIRIRSVHDFKGAEEFHACVQLHQEILQAYLTNFLESNVVYVLGKKPMKQTELHSTSGKEVQIGNLERQILCESPQLSFSEIVGNEEGKRAMQGIYIDIINPQISQFFGINPQESRNGYLLLGPSGTGKNMLVKALATKVLHQLGSKMKFYSVNYSDITSIYRGGEALATKALFELIKQNEAADIYTLLFLDEIQSIGIRRREHNESLDTFLSLFGGIQNYKKLTLIAATYFTKEQLDPAFVRRFDHHIELSLPDHQQRQGILQLYVDKYAFVARESGHNDVLFDIIDLATLADRTQNLSGDDLQRLVQGTIKRKKASVLERLSENPTNEELRAVFTSISTSDILEQIPLIKKEKSKMGYKV